MPVAALLIGIGGATAAAAPDHGGVPQAHAQSPAGGPAKAPNPVRFTWHALKLINGWKSASTKTLVTGGPAWASRDGVVYLRGAIKQPNAVGSTTFFSLPKYARPAHNLYIQVYTTKGIPGILYIGSDGSMEAYDGNAFTFTSLASVSFPTATVTSHLLSLINGWVSSQSVYQTGDPAYDVSHGVVHLSGSMHSGGSSHLAFVLPKAARPAHEMYIAVYTFDGSTGLLQIARTGQVDVSGPGAAAYTSLANISFPVATTKWHSFKLDDGWKSGARRFHTAGPAYTVINGVVYMTGSMYQAGGTKGRWTAIPKPARPVDALVIGVGTSHGNVGMVTVTHDLGRVSSIPYSNAQAFTSLAGIDYPLSS